MRNRKRLLLHDGEYQSHRDSGQNGDQPVMMLENRQYFFKGMAIVYVHIDNISVADREM